MKLKWAYFETFDFDKAMVKALELGYKENKVQVRKRTSWEGLVSYEVEPFDDCKCVNVTRYTPEDA